MAILSFFGLRHFLSQRELIKKHLSFVVFQGLLGVAGFNTLVYLALQSTTAINAVLVNSCIPVLIGVFSWLLYREAMSVRQVIGVFLSLFGVVLIIARGDLEFVASMNFNRGDLLVFLAALLWALYSANLKRYPQELHPLAYLSGIVIVGTLGISPLYCIELFAGHSFKLTAATLVTILYVSLFASVLAFIFWNSAVRTVGPNKAGPFIHLMPVFSTILAMIFLGESLQIYHLFGVPLIFLGIFLTSVSRRKKKV